MNAGDNTSELVDPGFDELCGSNELAREACDDAGNARAGGNVLVMQAGKCLKVLEAFEPLQAKIQRALITKFLCCITE